jgi:hypothetical protein
MGLNYNATDLFVLGNIITLYNTRVSSRKKEKRTLVLFASFPHGALGLIYVQVRQLYPSNCYIYMQNYSDRGVRTFVQQSDVHKTGGAHRPQRAPKSWHSQRQPEQKKGNDSMSM